jgi:sigma-B regulation protein RsbU (phosphoserine phosphatase)
LTLDRSADVPLGPILEQVVNELRSGWPGRQIDRAIDLPRPINCDPARIAQLLSNLLANALKHGADKPVSVRAFVQEDTFELSVANQGNAIPPEVIKRLFEPFYRPLASADKEGLGLGLYIASAIAHAHRGTLDVASTGDETRFVFRMPAS